MDTYIALSQSVALLNLLQKRVENSKRRIESADFEDESVRNELLESHRNDANHIDLALFHVNTLLDEYFKQMDY